MKILVLRLDELPARTPLTDRRRFASADTRPGGSFSDSPRRAASRPDRPSASWYWDWWRVTGSDWWRAGWCGYPCSWPLMSRGKDRPSPNGRRWSGTGQPAGWLDRVSTEPEC